VKAARSVRRERVRRRRRDEPGEFGPPWDLEGEERAEMASSALASWPLEAVWSSRMREADERSVRELRWDGDLASAARDLVGVEGGGRVALAFVVDLVEILVVSMGWGWVAGCSTTILVSTTSVR